MRKPLTCSPVWVSRLETDVPAGDGWLGDRERAVLAGLEIAPRRASWRLGRWTAKLALGACLETEPTRIEVLAAADGAPEPWLDGVRVPLSISISHRAGRAIATVAGGSRAVGCDLELLEPRSDAFIREWLSEAEQQVVAAAAAGPERALATNLIWTAKEAAAKVRREGLRLDVRDARVVLGGQLDRRRVWQPLEVSWGDAAGPTAGWWRTETAWVMAVAAAPALAEAPVAIRGG